MSAAAPPLDYPPGAGLSDAQLARLRFVLSQKAQATSITDPPLRHVSSQELAGYDRELAAFVPALLTEVERLRAELARREAEREEALTIVQAELSRAEALAEIRRLDAERTPGTWNPPAAIQREEFWYESGWQVNTPQRRSVVIGDYPGEEKSGEADAAFIAAASWAVPALLADNERLRAELARYKSLTTEVDCPFCGTRYDMSNSRPCPNCQQWRPD